MKMGVDLVDRIYEELVDVLKVKLFLIDVRLFVQVFYVYEYNYDLRLSF